MRKIITTTMITLDGVMQAPGGSKEDIAEGFKYGGWQSGYWNEEGDTIMDTKIQADPFDLLLGKRTYGIFASYWPLHKDEAHWGKPFDVAKKYVVAHKSFELLWDNSILITGDIITEIKNLKKSDGPNLLVYGSGNLIQTLLKNHLIDRMHIWTFPLTIGYGKKLFSEGTQPEHFKPIDGKITSTGLIYAAYEPLKPLNEESM